MRLVIDILLDVGCHMTSSSAKGLMVSATTVTSRIAFSGNSYLGNLPSCILPRKVKSSAKKPRSHQKCLHTKTANLDYAVQLPDI